MSNPTKYLSPSELITVAELSAMQRINEASAMLTRRHDAAGRNPNRHRPENDHSGYPNTAVGSEGSILMRRALNMDGNNGFARQARRVSANGIVGTGIRPSVRTQDKALEKRILQFWSDATHNQKIDHNGHESFVGLCHQIHDAVFTTGDAIIRRRRQKDGSFKLQVHEADYLDSSMSGMPNDSGGYTMHGIEYNGEGEVLAYWLFDSLDDENIFAQVTSRRIPASEICHAYYADRAGQRRGLPWLRSVYVALMDLTRYMDADLQRSIVAACHAIFVTNSPDTIGIGSSTTRPEFDEIQPGDAYYLNQGEDVTFNTPPAHNSFPEYVKSILQLIASGVGLTYESISGDYSNVNFSSAKMGANEMDRNFAEKRERMMMKPLNTVWSWFMESLVSRGLLRMSYAEATAIEADWTAPRRAMIDMVKETEGLRLQIAAGLISWQEAVRMCGGDPEDVHAELIAALGLMELADFVPTWLVPTMEIHELANETEAKMTTAKASMKTASKPTPTPKAAPKLPAGKQ